jgi:hypothetical protein
MKDILNLFDELIEIARAEDLSRDPRSLKKKDGGECFIVHHLQILKQSVIDYDNSRTGK